EMVDQVLEKFGKIDIIVNNVGIHEGAPFWEETEESWLRQFKVNVLGVVIPSQIVVPHMMKRRKGKIIMMSSKAAVVGEPNHAAYSASKGAVLALTRAMAIELAPYNINVNAICPGPTYTDMLLKAMPDPKDREELRKFIPLGRFGDPKDIAGAALYLASSDSDWCTGQAISVDGGMSILK
ncbi:MAG: SDR family oxidoreductase, partial [Nitrososphaerota archaeon]